MAGLAGAALLFLAAVPAQAPADERLKRRHQLAALGGQPVGHLDRHGGHHLADQYSRGVKLLEPLGEHPVRQSRYGRADLGEPARTAGDGHQDGRTPPAADQLDRSLEEPALVVVDMIPPSSHLLKVSDLCGFCKGAPGPGD